MMHPQVELLIQIQDLDLMIRELSNEKTASAEKKMGFELSGMEALKDAREALAKRLDGEWMRRYERITARFPRAIVPMREGVCFGCFMRQPAHKAVGDVDPNRIESCQHCGRILFALRVG